MQYNSPPMAQLSDSLLDAGLAAVNAEANGSQIGSQIGSNGRDLNLSGSIYDGEIEENGGMSRFSTSPHAAAGQASVHNVARASAMAVAAESAHKKNEHIHQLSPQEERIMNAFEALDYDLCENKLFEREQLQMTAEDKRSEELIGWLIFFLIGAGTGTCAAIIDAGVEYLLEIRWGWSGRLLTGGTQSTTDDDSPVSAFFMDVLLCMAFVGISSGLVVWVEPAAAGSGIPDMKGYLNGTNLRATLTMKALLAKGVGVVFAVGGGLCVGKEGPLVHAGSVLAANVSHGFDSCVAKFKTWKKFRTDAHKVRFLRATPMHDHAVLCMGALTGGGRFCSGTSCRGAARRASPPPSARRWAGCSSRSRRPRRSGRCRLHGRASSAR